MYVKTQRLQILAGEVRVLYTKVGSKCGTKCKLIKLKITALFHGFNITGYPQENPRKHLSDHKILDINKWNNALRFFFLILRVWSLRNNL
jgi:hypothetical protein